MTNKVLLLTREQDEYEQKLRTYELPDLEIFAPRSEREVLAVLPQVNIIFANPRLARQYVSEAKKLVWFQSTFAGVDALIADSLRSDYILTNVKDTYGEVMSEYVLAYILMFERQLLQHMQAQQEKHWSPKEAATLQNRTIGILGTGSIGKYIAKMARFFGMKVLGFHTSLQPVENFDAIYNLETIPGLLQEADFVISVLPKTRETTKLIDKRMFSVMKPNAVFINIGRGDNVNEDDLIKALSARQIRAAVLDVFMEEPLPEQHPFWSMQNVYVTPHVSGYYNSKQIFEIFAENYRRFTTGKVLKYQVDFRKGY